MTFTLRQLQEELVPWVRHNFGDRPAWMPLIGVCEELGELVEAALINKADDIADAYADAIIFATDYCGGMGWDAQTLWENALELGPALPPLSLGSELLIRIGRLQKYHLKIAQGIRGSREEHEANGRLCLTLLFSVLIHNAGGADTVLRIVEHTWQRVSKRDWKKNPKTGEVH